MNSNNHSLTLKTKIGFGVCDIGGNLFFTTLSFHLTIFLTDTLGLAAGLMGLAMMIGRIVDAFSDPLMGYISDHTKSKWGRRRPYIFFGSIPLVFFFILMFSSPEWISSQRGLFIWVTIIYFLMTTSYTIVNIPYGALTPDLTRDYNQQTVLNGYRMSFAVVENNFAETGIRREGIYYGLWTFLSKLGQAVSALIIGTVLTLVHYNPGIEQTSTSEMGIRMLVGPVPVILIVLGMIVMYRYPITSKNYKEILQKIEKRESYNA